VGRTLSLSVRCAASRAALPAAAALTLMQRDGGALWTAARVRYHGTTARQQAALEITMTDAPSLNSGLIEAPPPAASTRSSQLSAMQVSPDPVSMDVASAQSLRRDTSVTRATAAAAAQFEARLHDSSTAAATQIWSLWWSARGPLTSW
jgi:uncharacterized protein involved in outer membrane biogenesis